MSGIRLRPPRRVQIKTPWWHKTMPQMPHRRSELKIQRPLLKIQVISAQRAKIKERRAEMRRAVGKLNCLAASPYSLPFDYKLKILSFDFISTLALLFYCATPETSLPEKFSAAMLYFSTLNLARHTKKQSSHPDVPTSKINGYGGFFSRVAGLTIAAAGSTFALFGDMGGIDMAAMGLSILGIEKMARFGIKKITRESIVELFFRYRDINGLVQAIKEQNLPPKEQIELLIKMKKKIDGLFSEKYDSMELEKVNKFKELHANLTKKLLPNTKEYLRQLGPVKKWLTIIRLSIKGIDVLGPRSIARRIINAPKLIFGKIMNHPVKTGLVTLAVDRLSKISIRNLYFQHITNKGGAFGSPVEFSTSVKLGLAFGIVSLAGLFTKAKSKITKLSIALILSGGLGNILDRVLYGGVTDFIKIGPWPIFNLADAAITSGGFLLLYECFSKQTTFDNSSRGQILKNSFTKNFINTLGQVFLYGLVFWAITGICDLLNLLVALPLSLIRDIRHSGRRMF